MRNVPRKVNDAQVERLLDAMRRDVNYRRELSERIVKSEGVKKFTAKTHKVRAEWKRRYSSTMRRFQRYTTEAGERRSFVRAPVDFQQEVRKEARWLPLPGPEVQRKVRRTPTRLGHYYEDLEPEPEFELALEIPRAHQRDLSEYSLQPLLRAIVAYHDGDVDEAGEVLNLSKRAVDVLTLATQGEGAQIEGLRGSGEIIDNVSEWLDRLPLADVQDLRDFHDLLMNLPDWQIGMIIGDLEDSGTTFSDWLDAWRNDGMDLDAETSEYWELWRAAYARAKA